MIPSPGETVYTQDGSRLVLGELIGRGGQGAVFAHGEDRCVKVYFEQDATRREQVRQRLLRLQQLRATERLVLPVKVLRTPHLGYVMARVQGSVALQTLCVPNSDIVHWYARTGGLRRRLLLGAELAHAFQELHARGLAYCDLNWENVLVPPNGRPEVRLIDTDNLSVEGAPDSEILGTAWFIAPEVLRGHNRPDTLSDTHSLSVLLYHLLVLTHPLLGDRVKESDPSWETKALEGLHPEGPRHLPWIDHPHDEWNRCSGGLPRHLVLSRTLRELFDQAFTHGLGDRNRRPTEGSWADALLRAADATRTCASCRNTTFLDLKSSACPWCNADLLPMALVVAHHPNQKRPLVVERRRRLFPRHLRFGRGSPSDGPVAELVTNGHLTLRAISQTLDVRIGDERRSLRQGDSVQLAKADRFQLPGQNPVFVVR